MTYTYFKDSEIVGLAPALVQMLDQARALAGIPFVITSGLRTNEQEIANGRAPNGPHQTGLAVDLHCQDSRSRFLILKALLYVGFTRIGDEVDHIHADICTTFDVEVVWLK